MMANDSHVIYTAIRRDRRTVAAAFPHHADPLMLVGVLHVRGS